MSQESKSKLTTEEMKVLREEQNLTYREIAEVAGITQHAVWLRLLSPEKRKALRAAKYAHASKSARKQAKRRAQKWYRNNQDRARESNRRWRENNPGYKKHVKHLRSRELIEGCSWCDRRREGKYASWGS